MRTARRESLILVALLIATLALTGCGTKKWYWPFGKKASTTEQAAQPGSTPAGYSDPYTFDQSPPVPPVAGTDNLSGPTNLPYPQNVIAPDPSGSLPQAEPIRQAPVIASELEMVHFDYDRSELTPQARQILDQNAEWLLQHPGIVIQIEGHCDERGTVEYNLTLGQRRADSVREYLVSKGIDPNTLHAITYGKERPLAMGVTEAEHAMNRRAQFFVFAD